MATIEKDVIEHTKDDKEIEFETSAFPSNLEVGSKESIQLLKAGKDPQNKEIFNSDAKKLIEYKWNQIYYKVLCFVLCNLWQTVFLSMHISGNREDLNSFFNSTLFFELSLAFNIILYISEIIQLCTEGPRIFMTDMWNIINLISFVCLTTYCIMQLTPYQIGVTGD